MESLAEAAVHGATNEGGQEEGGDEEYYVKAGYIAVLFLLIVYTMVGSFIESTKSGYIHETGVAIILGMTISLIARFFGFIEMSNILEFSESLFFYVCLPPIVFSAGYNMKRKKFFQHFNYIALFGICGTFTCFTFFSFFTGLLFYIQPMSKYIPETGVTEDFKLTLREILLLCSLMCSSDVVAAVSLIDFQKEPKLFSMVFGEGITNDAVSIILFNTVFKYTGETEKFSTQTVFKVVLEFTKLAAASVG
jgi:sodium/hydrogen exchanger-like protein 6/7/sodium/hydrogen exchanger 8